MQTQIGIFAKHLSRSTPEELFDDIAAFGFNCVQFNAACLGVPSLPDTIDNAQWRRARRAARNAGVQIVGLSATFNLLDENRARLADNFRRLDLESARTLAYGFVYLLSSDGPANRRVYLGETPPEGSDQPGPPSCLLDMIQPRLLLTSWRTQRSERIWLAGYGRMRSSNYILPECHRLFLCRHGDVD